MPTPLDLLLDPLTLSVIAIFAGLALWEAIFPARALAPRARLAHQGLVSVRRLHGDFFLPAVSVGRLARTIPALRPVGA